MWRNEEKKAQKLRPNMSMFEVFEYIEFERGEIAGRVYGSSTVVITLQFWMTIKNLCEL